MGLQSFLDANDVKGIDRVLVDVADTVVGPMLVASYAVPPAPPVPAVGMPAAAVAAIIARTQAPSAAGALLLFTLLLADLTALVYPILTAGAAGLLKVPPLGVPAGPIAAVALATPSLPGPPPDPQSKKFAKAALQWAVSLLPPGDLRVIVPFVVT